MKVGPTKEFMKILSVLLPGFCGLLPQAGPPSGRKPVRGTRQPAADLSGLATEDTCRAKTDFNIFLEMITALLL